MLELHKNFVSIDVQTRQKPKRRLIENKVKSKSTILKPPLNRHRECCFPSQTLIKSKSRSMLARWVPNDYHYFLSISSFSCFINDNMLTSVPSFSSSFTASLWISLTAGSKSCGSSLTVWCWECHYCSNLWIFRWIIIFLALFLSLFSSSSSFIFYN